MREADDFVHVTADGVFVVGDDHGAAAEHVAGTNEHRDSRGALRYRTLLRRWWRCRSAGDGIFRSSSSLAEELAVFREIDILGIGTDDGHAEALERQGEIERSLAAELDYDAVGLFGVEMFRTSSRVRGSK